MLIFVIFFFLTCFITEINNRSRWYDFRLSFLCLFVHFIDTMWSRRKTGSKNTGRRSGSDRFFLIAASISIIEIKQPVSSQWNCYDYNHFLDYFVEILIWFVLFINFFFLRNNSCLLHHQQNSHGNSAVFFSFWQRIDGFLLFILIRNRIYRYSLTILGWFLATILRIFL